MKKQFSLLKIIKDWFTGPDGETYDPARFLWFVGIVVFLVFAGTDMYKTNRFDMEQFAFAYGSLLAAGAAGIKIKETTEPTGVVQPVVAPALPVPVIQPLPKPIIPAPVISYITDDDIPRPPKC